MVRILFFISLLLMPVFAQKKAFTLDDLYKIKSVKDAQISPDGKRIAFSVTQYNLSRGTTNADIYLMDSDGKNLIRLTNNKADDTHPRWHKDGKHILFISTRVDGPQAWIIRADGGEAGQLTDFKMGVSDAEWLGDGFKIVFSSTVFPDLGADNTANEQREKSLTTGPLQAHLADELLYRHWTYWKDGKREHILEYDPDTDAYRDLTPGDFDFPAFGGSFAVSPDGRKVVVESNHDKNEYETTNKDLFNIDVKSLKSVNLTKTNKAYDGQPEFSPNGRYLAYVRQLKPGFESDRSRLMLYDYKTGKIKTLTEKLDYSVAMPHWGPDSKTIYFRVQEKGKLPLYKADVTSGKIGKVVQFATVDDYDIAPDGKWMALTHRAIAAPREIFRTDTRFLKKNKKYRRLTSFNRKIEQTVDLRPPQEVWIDSPTGQKVHAFLIKPHNFDPTKKYPAIINVHGGPQGQWTDGFRGDWQMYPGAGYVLIFPNPHGSTGYGQAYTDEISGDYGGKVFQDVMAVTDYLAKLPYVDENRLGAMGWSYGGYMMNWLQGHTTRFKAIVSMMGLYDLKSFYGATEELWFPQWDLGGVPWQSPQYVKWSPDNYVKNFQTPTLIITGERDYRVPYTQSLEYFTALRKKNIDARLIVFKNDGHWPSFIKSMPFYYNAHLDWFHKYLGGAPAPYDMKKMWLNQAY